jgi:hypothetical protein
MFSLSGRSTSVTPFLNLSLPADLVRAVACVLLAAAAALLLAGCSTLPSSEGEVPAALAPAAGARLLDTRDAIGAQVYSCERTPAGLRWVFVQPEAVLFDLSGRANGWHFQGPHWQALDGSSIKGRVAASAPAPRSDAIPWLLLTANSNGAPGAFSGVTQVQRIATVGGLAPAADACTETRVSERVRVHYTARYRFFVGDASAGQAKPKVAYRREL